MAVDSSAPSSRRRSLFDALFGEAWGLERRRRRRYVALVLLMCLAAAVALSLTGRGKSSPAAIGPAKPLGLTAAGAVDIGSSPQALLPNAGSLWIATPNSTVRLNLRNGSMIARIPIPTNGVNAGLAFGAGSVWLAPTGTSQLLRIDPTTDRIVAKINLGVARNGRISSPSNNHATARPITVGSGPDTIVSAFGALWVDNTSVVVGDKAPSATYPALSRIDPRTRHVTTEPFSGTPATGFGSLWVQTDAGADDAAIIRVNPATGQTLAQIAVPRVIGVASGDGRVWAISYPRSRSASLFEAIKGTAELWQIDPTTNRVIGKPTHLSLTQPVSIAVSGQQLWIADYQSGKVIHFQLTKR